MASSMLKGEIMPGADELARVGLAKFVKPVVIGTRQRGGEFAIQVRDAQNVQPAARVENSEVYPFFCHRVELDL